MSTAAITSKWQSSSSTSRSGQLIVAVLALLVAVGAARAFAEKLRISNSSSTKKRPVSVRLVGRAVPLPASSFGANYTFYVATLESQNDNKKVSLVKLVYRYLNYDQSLPATFMDYDFVHSFRAVRQADCDEQAEALLYSRRLGPSGGALDRDFSFEYAKHAGGISIPPADMLPCYVVVPADYKESHRRADPSGTIVAEKEPSLARTPKAP